MSDLPDVSQVGEITMMYRGVPFDYVWIQGCIVGINTISSEEVLINVDDGTGCLCFDVQMIYKRLMIYKRCIRLYCPFGSHPIIPGKL